MPGPILAVAAVRFSDVSLLDASCGASWALCAALHAASCRAHCKRLRSVSTEGVLTAHARQRIEILRRKAFADGLSTAGSAGGLLVWLEEAQLLSLGRAGGITAGASHLFTAAAAGAGMVEDMRKIKKHARTTPQKAAASAWGAASKAALAGWSGTGLAMLLTEWWWTPYLSPLLFFISVVCATISVMKKSSIDADRRPPSIRP